MNSFAFPWKEHYFFKYVTYLCTRRVLFSISALRSSLSFTALLKQSLTTSWSSWPRTKCFSQRFSTLSLKYYSFSCPSSFSQEIKSFSLLFLCFNNSELTNYVTRVPGQFFGFESYLLWNLMLAKKNSFFITKYSVVMVKVKPTKKKLKCCNSYHLKTPTAIFCPLFVHVFISALFWICCLLPFALIYGFY